MMRGVGQLYNILNATSRIFLIFLCAIFLPRVFLVYVQTSSTPTPSEQQVNFKLGLENLSDDFLCNLTPKGDLSYSAALVTNQSGKDQSGKRNLDILLQRGIKINALFAPEHGIDGDHLAAHEVHNTIDKKTNIPIISLCGKGVIKEFSEDMLSNIDVIFFDIQDAGIRYYTYITTLFKLLKAASLYKKTIVVLDRPNFLGAYMEGPLVDPSLISSISAAPIPIRYGMTIGELANYYNQHMLSGQVKLHIAPMKYYNRYHPRNTGLLDVLSPNIKSMASCHGYSFLGLLGEVRPFNLGVGTDKAFQCILLPDTIKFSKHQWYQLHLLLKKKGVNTSFYRYYSKRKKCFYSGIQLAIPDINTFSSFNTLLDVLMFFKKAGVKLTFSPHFDKAAGTPLLRNYILGNIRRSQLEDIVNRDLKEFHSKIVSACIYQPLPCVVELGL